MASWRVCGVIGDQGHPVHWDDNASDGLTKHIRFQSFPALLKMISNQFFQKTQRLARTSRMAATVMAW